MSNVIIEVMRIFYAMNSSGQMISIFQLSYDQKKNRLFYCPVCKEPLRIRHGPKVTPHFAHLPRSTCKRGESLEHDSGKWLLYSWLVSQGYQVELEKYLPDIRQRPDLFITTPNKQIAIEYQCATIPGQHLSKRTISYQSHQIFPLWILGMNQLKKKGDPFIHFSSFLKNFLYAFNESLTLYFLNTSNDTINTYSHLQYITPSAVFGKKQSLPLKETPFRDLFKPSPHVYYPFPYWEKLLYNYRMRYSPFVSSEERQFRQYLYLKGLHFTLIPTLSFIPLKGDLLVSGKPHIWKTRYLMDHFFPRRIGEIVIFPQVPSLSTVNNYKPDLAKEYLMELEKLGFVKNDHGRRWIKVRDLHVYKDLDEARYGDHQLEMMLKKLKRIKN